MDAQTVWLVTGASSGLGAAIALAALRAGHKVIACARNPAKAAQTIPDIEQLGGWWLKLDVTSTETEEIVHRAIQDAGRIDVVVNNAGFLAMGALEDLSDDEIHAQMNTNFYGAIRVIKGCLPTMRMQRSGTIVNMSSVFGVTGTQPAASMYCASKFALEGLSESLVADLTAAFNIRIVLVEPGFFRTNFGGASGLPKGGLSKPYAETAVGKVLQLREYLIATPEALPGDPTKLGQRVVEFVDGTGMAKGLEGYLRLPLGKDMMEMAREKLRSLQGNLDALEEIALSTDFEGATVFNSM